MMFLRLASAATLLLVAGCNPIASGGTGDPQTDASVADQGAAAEAGADATGSTAPIGLRLVSREFDRLLSTFTRDGGVSPILFKVEIAITNVSSTTPLRVDASFFSLVTTDSRELRAGSDDFYFVMTCQGADQRTVLRGDSTTCTVGFLLASGQMPRQLLFTAPDRSVAQLALGSLDLAAELVARNTCERLFMRRDPSGCDQCRQTPCAAVETTYLRCREPLASPPQSSWVREYCRGFAEIVECCSAELDARLACRQTHCADACQP